MSFLLPSLPTFASRASSYLHPHHSEPEPPKLHISVTPLQPSTFAGEVFQAKISFRVSQPEPTTSTQPPFLHPSSSTANGISPFAPEQTVFTTPGRPFAPSHRVAQSLSIRGIEGGSRLPQTAGPVLEASSSPSNGQPSSLGYPSLMSLEKHGSQEFPPRRGQVGKQPRPKLAALRRVSHQEGHARQRSASGSDLPVLGERRGTEPVVESPVARDKGKGRAPATGGRSQSMSGPLNGMGNYRPPPREERAVATSSPTRTPTRSTPSSLSTLPSRDTPPSIPASHPHARKPSYMPASSFASSSSSPLPDPHLDAFPRPGGSTTRSGSISPSSSRAFGLSSISESPITGLGIHQLNGTPTSELDGSSGQDQDVNLPPSEEADDPFTDSPSRPPPRTANSIGLGRPPSFLNPFHSSSASAPPLPPLSSSPQGLVITWSYVHLVSSLTPSPQYLPPESLLPLRHTLLQSSIVGTGSFPSPPVPHSQGWFTLPPPSRHSRAPSLTSSLFGLAKGVVWGRGGESSLEGERRRKWEESVKEVPVLETLKSVMGVGVELGGKDGKDTLDFVYSLPVPASLPPTFQGKALKISYTLVIGVEVEYPLPPGQRAIDDFGRPRRPLRKSKVLRIPIRIWGGVDAPTAKQGYDLMNPVIQRKEEAELEELDAQLAKKLVTLDELEKEEHDRTPLPSTATSFDSYALHLLSTLPPPASPSLLPLPESSSAPTTPSPTPTTTPKTHRHTRSQALSPLSHSVLLPEVLVGAEGKPSRRASLAVRLNGGIGVTRYMAGLGPDEDGEGAEEVLEGLLRGSQKASYDIEKDGQVVAVFTLVKSAYRLGETVQGVLNFNQGDTSRRVLKCSALLQTHEIIPSPLALSLPPTHPSYALISKPLKKTHADHHSSLTLHTTRLPFALDIPSPGTAGGVGIAPSFVLRADGDAEGKEKGRVGGVEWKIRLSFLVSVPLKGGGGAVSVRPTPTHLVPSWKVPGLDPRHVGYEPAGSIAPVLPFPPTPVRGGRKEKAGEGEVDWKEMRTEVVECDVPIVVYPHSKLGVGEGEEGEEMGVGGTVSLVV